jgi:hypothetical protein
MKRLCEEAGIELDDRHGYLAPHGGHRGMGEVLVRQFGYAIAVRYLDNSEQRDAIRISRRVNRQIWRLKRSLQATSGCEIRSIPSENDR